MAVMVVDGEEHLENAIARGNRVARSRRSIWTARSAGASLKAHVRQLAWLT